MQTHPSHDDAVANQTAEQPVADTLKALFYVVGDADPAFLPRVLEPVAKLGHVPSRVHASAEAGDGNVMTVDLRVPNVAQVLAERMENALRRVVGVHQVIAVYERG
ncbi:MAG: hypothetical protein JXQ99_25420 [Hyphomicrobiaceae bacterium]